LHIIIAILIFGFIIIFHELGHFSVAKACGVRVNEFTVGFGPKLFSFGKGETKYSLRLLPFGGACVMEGEDSDSEDDRAFNKKPLWQRFLIVFAGPLFNFILAFLLSLIMIGSAGYYAPNVGGVTKDYPAEQAGIKAGDTIVSIDGYPIHFYNEISVYTFFHKKSSYNVKYRHGGVLKKSAITPKYDKKLKRSLIGIVGSPEMTHPGFLGTIQYGFYEIKYQIYVVFQSLKELVLGHLTINDMSGPVGIVKTIGDTYKESVADGIYYVVMNMINITILLSANLGVMNLLPFPALDGGRLLIFIIEGITRKKIPEKVEAYINAVGFVILMVLMVLIMGNDIRRIITRQL